MEKKLVIDAKKTLEIIGVKSNSDDEVFVWLYSPLEQGTFIEEITCFSNSFNIRDIVFLEDDFYPTLVRSKIKKIKRGVGKINTPELKKYIKIKEGAPFFNGELFFDYVSIENKIQEESMSILCDAMYKKTSVNILLRNGCSNINTSPKSIIENYFDNSICDVCRLFMGETIDGDRFAIAVNTVKNNSIVKDGFIKECHSEGFDKIIKNCTHIYPLKFDNQLSFLKSRRGE
ncbi:hypothetical protein HQN64_23435 [Enterobacteriaceae bacterium BIT-l23]|uniref:hypothetical protein n=1 Tax=Jejubacter sp. L23 TaxID=3092086 RepID=UPI001584538B|nr:hypothetical protein [Enterobacteriaceae bacterium BIT-l23]